MYAQYRHTNALMRVPANAMCCHQDGPHRTMSYYVQQCSAQSGTECGHLPGMCLQMKAYSELQDAAGWAALLSFNEMAG